MRVAINGNRHQEGHFDDIDRLVTAFVSRGDTVVMTDRFLTYLCENLGDRFAAGLEYMPLSRQPRADLALSIGGDGAFLKTARWVGDAAIPVAGINTGHLGYLSAFSFDRPDELRHCLLDGHYELSSRSVLQIELPDGKRLFGLNEVAVARGENASMVHVELSIDGHAALSYLGDGLIVATPTGSTAYNLSVGGPILDPRMEAMVISPVAAHSLAVRPLVVSGQSVLHLKVSLRAPNFRLSVDGRSFTVADGSTIAVVTAPYRANIVRVPGTVFTDTLRAKFME